MKAQENKENKISNATHALKTPSTLKKAAPSRSKLATQQGSISSTANTKEVSKKNENNKLTISDFSAKKQEKEVISLHSSGSSEKKQSLKKKTNESGLKQSSLDNFMIKTDKGKRKEKDFIIDVDASDPGPTKMPKVKFLIKQLKKNNL